MDDLTRIVQRLLEQLRVRLEQQGMTLTWDEAVLEYLSREGYSEQFGARELRRVIEQQVEKEIVEKILREEIRLGHVVSVDVKDNMLVLKIYGGETR